MVFSRQKENKLAICFLIFTVTILWLHCGSGGSPIKIKSAKRAYKLLVGDRFHPQELTPVNPATHVVLDLQIKGISIDDFNNIDQDNKYIIVGERICRPNITSSGIYGGKKKIRLCVVVPKDAQELTLYIGSFTPKTFKVKGKIYNELKDW